MKHHHHQLHLSSTRYNVEKRFRSPPPSRPSIEEQRTDRLLKELVEEDKLTPLMEKAFVPKTIFERNVSPGLQEETGEGKVWSGAGGGRKGDKEADMGWMREKDKAGHR